MQHIILSYLIVFISSTFAFGESIERHASGLIRSYETDANSTHQKEVEAFQEFSRLNFPFVSSRHQWKEVLNIKDNTHTHKTYALYYEGRRISGQYLKTHYSAKGFIEYASSNISSKVEGFMSPPTRDAQVFWQVKAREEFEKQFQRPLNGAVSSEPVIFVDEKGESHSALEIRVINDAPMYVREFTIDEMTGKVLKENRTSRDVSIGAKVYKVSPFGGSAAESVTLTTDSATQLSNSNFYVRREENISTPTLVDITPADYTGAIKSDPTQYNYACTGTSNDCPDQSFDGVNVYYHLSQYRNRIGTYLSELGASVTFPGEPIPVLVNTLTLDDKTYSQLSNNASYSTHCRSDGSMPRCMAFLRPALISAKESQASCNSTTAVSFHDFSREAIVVAHEYQHYVTDTITQIVNGCDRITRKCAVGDAIHEAISDYLAATYVSDLAGRDVTLVAEYALQNCTPLQRQLNTLKVYENTAATEDVHLAGLTWASAYWKLKTEYGTAVIDKLLIKSLFYEPTSPSFGDTVETLVKADKALYGGVHAARIRQLFYDELKIYAGQTGIFRDSAKGIIEIGTKGCSSVGLSQSSGGLSILSFCLWLLATLIIPRKFGRKK